MLIIPAIDIINGECVRLRKGDYGSKTVYFKNPVKVARKFEKDGAKMLHIVDLDAAKSGKPENLKTIIKIRKIVNIPIEIGGGIRSLEIADKYIKAGVNRLIIGTKAIENLNFIKDLIKRFGAEKIVVGLDAINGKLATNGWLKKSNIDYLVFAKKLKKIGITEIIFTDISRDGMLTKPNFKAISELARMNFNLIASGGISDISDVEILSGLNIYGIIIGKALYENKVCLREAVDAVKPLTNLTKRIIPCLDVANSRVVKGINFKNLKDSGDPVELGKKYSEEGADELVFLDIKATKENRKTTLDMVRRISENVFIPFTVGGGVSNITDIKNLLLSGADKVSINTAAVLNPALIFKAAKKFGNQCIVVAIDAKKINGKYKVFTRGGSQKTGLDVFEWTKKVESLGAGEILLTSMDRDGTKRGFDIELLEKISSAVKIPVIASGGAGSLKDLKIALNEGKADAVLAASLFHFNEISISQAKKYLSKFNIPMRI
ncbi:MAG: imidazole glycerol phosphate synthase subunit HisF, cyclase [Candidatus Peregrinibacteria bacterium GW2011_GWF2_38_29]|nr:MAG: imidazole glycerol phosphate synthase subunit HisF, cyclase [Candidatus Peregrinibacteria bacterium GW2011_GWF2_38_29]HBB02343.1 hypothetical protein [Candidatus Peregrinibacteria bacterium]